jgi:hypothetical protein
VNYVRLGVIRTAMLLLATVTILSFTARGARAETGWVAGTFKFWNKNGNFCPYTAFCNGAVYTEGMEDVAQPISNAFVVVQGDSGGIIGSGWTDVSGVYSIAWATPIGSPPSQIRVAVAPRHERFVIYNPQGTASGTNSITPWVNAIIGTTQANAQQFGKRTVGSSSLPQPYFNAFWAAELQWRTTLAFIGVLINDFTGVEARGFQDTIVSSTFIPITDTCTSSCTVGSLKQVQFDTDAAFSPQSRAMHEFGHVASYLVRPWKVGVDDSLNGSGWDWSQSEHASMAFEEAIATHYGNITFWNTLSATPTTCLAGKDEYCYNVVTPPATSVPVAFSDFEASSWSGATNNCSVNEGQLPISMLRFLWDVFDGRNDTTRDSYSALAGHYWQHASLMQFYDAGTGQFDHEEPWNGTKTTVTEPEGRGAGSYAWNYVNRASLPNIDSQRSDNCQPL